MFYFAVKIVEANPNPSGLNLVNPYRTNKVESMDLVALAQEIQKVNNQNI